MNDSPTAELTIALLGDPASFERMMAAADARLDKFLHVVDVKGQQIQASVDRMLGSVSSSASKLDAAIQPVVTALSDVASSASVAGAEVRAAAGDLRAVSGDASAAAKSLTSVGTAGRSAGAGIAAGMTQTVTSVQRGQSALNQFAGMVNRARAAASKPIVQRVTVQRTGSTPGIGGEFRGRAGGEAAGSAITQAGSSLTEVGLSLAAPLVAASAAVNAFDKAIEDAANNTTMTAADVDTLRTNVIALARETNAPLDKIAAAFMRAANFGYSGAKGMEVVRAANIAATASGADLEKVTEAVAQTMNQFHIPVEDASRVMNLLSYASDSTNQKLDSFVATAGRGFQAAATLHVGLADAAAVMGVLTEKGLSAAQSQTAFRAIVKGIIQPTNQARDAIKALSDKTGIDLVGAFSAAGLAHYGLVRVMDMATRATNGHADALKKIFTDSRNFVPMLTLMAEKHAELTRVMSGSEKAFLENSRTQEQYQARVKTAAYQLENLKNRAIIAGAAFEEQLAPAMIQVVSLLDRFLDFLQRLTPSEKQMLVDTLAAGAAVSLLGGAVLTLTGRLLTLANGIWTFVSWLLKIGPAAAAAETAEAGVATAGLAAFGPGAALIVALGVMVALVVRAGDMYLRMRDAINDAAAAGKNLATRQGQMMGEGERQADIATKNKIGIESGDLDSAIRVAKQIKPRSGENADDMKIIRDASVRNQLADAGYDTTNAAYNTMAGAATRLKALLTDQKKVDARLRQLNEGGGGERNRAATAVGADGFALAVSRIDPTSIQTTLKESCAEYVSKVFKQAGLDIPVIPGAKALRDKILAMGGQAHDGPALPGDLVVYHGGRMGTKAGGGYHVGVATGDGTDWESSRGKTKHESIAGNLKWSGPGTTVEYITVPGSTFSHMPSGSLPSYVTGSGGPKGTEADFEGDGKAKKTAVPFAGSLADLDLKPLDRILPLGDLHGAATDAANYEDKLHQLDDALADHDAKMSASGKGYDKYALKMADLAQRLVLAENAVRNTGQAISSLSPKVTAAEGKVEQDRRALNGLSDRMKGQKAAGLPKSDPAVWAAEVRRHEALRAQYGADMDAYRRDDAALKENRRVHAQALGDKDRVQGDMDAARAAQQQKALEKFLKTQSQAVKLGPDGGGVTRDQYDQELKDALAGKNKSLGALNPEGDDYARVQEALTQSLVTRQAAQGRIGKETLQLQKKDFDALEQDLDAEAQAYRDAGVQEADILTFRNLKQHEIDMARSAQARKDAVDGGKEMLDLGLETAGQYSRQLGQAIASLTDDWAKAGTEAEKQGFALQIARLRLEISKIDWDAAAKQAEGWKHAVDTGTLSTEEYILRLQDLQGHIPATAEEYQRLTTEIDAANKAMYDKAEQQAGSVASKATDQLMAVLQKAKTLKAAVRDSLKDAATDAVHKTIEDALKKQVLKIVLDTQASNMKKAADQHKKAADGGKTSAETMTAVAAGINKGANTFQTGVATFAEYVTKFVAAAAGGPVKATGSDASASSGGAKDNSSGLAAATAGLSGAATGNYAGGAVSALNASGDGGAAGQIGASILPDLQKGNDAGAAESGAMQAAGMGLLGNTAASVVPYLGAALALFSLFGPTKHTPTSTQSQQYAHVLTTFSPTIDSGFSGSEGLRDLLGNTTRAAAGVPAQGQAPGQSGHVFNFNIAAGAFQGVADPQGHATVLLQQVQTGLAQMTALDNASRGNG